MPRQFPRSVSVIATTYNQPVELELLLRTLAAQRDAPEFEVLVCDDGSSDASLDVVRRAAAQSRLELRYVWQPDQGIRVARSRNNAIRCAQGELLLLLDGDQVVPPELVQRHAALHDGRRRVVCGRRDFALVEPAALLRADDWTALLANHLSPPRLAPSTAERPTWSTMIGFCLSVPAAPEVRFDETIEGWGVEDTELAVRLWRLGYEFISPNDLPRSYHLGPPTPMRLTHEQIVAHVCNLFRVTNAYPRDEVLAAFEILRLLHVDAATDRWTVAFTRRAEPLADLVRDAAAWMTSHGIAWANGAAAATIGAQP